MNTLLHLLYFLPALIVYGIWTWWSWKNKGEHRLVWVAMHTFPIFFAIMFTIAWSFVEGIKYFTN